MTNNRPMDFTDPGPRIAGTRHGAWLLEARELLRLAVPLALTQLAQMAILATDALMLGHVSKEALAAAALGNTAFIFTWLIGYGPASAVAPMIAHILGAQPLTPAKTRAGVRAVVRMGLWSVVLLSLPLLGLLLATRPVLLLLGQDPALAAGAARFMSALAWGLPFSLGYQVLRNYATALGRTAAPLVVMGLAIAFNAAGDYALIFGHFGAPRMELLGSGLASTASNIFSFTALLTILLLTPGLKQYRILRRLLRADWAKLAEVFRLGMPMGLTMSFEVALFNAATLAIGTFGTAALAAHQIALLIPSITFMIPLGIGMAATVRVGLAAGGGDIAAARRAGFAAMVIAVAFMSGTAGVLLLFPHAIVQAWLSQSAANDDVIAIAVVFLHVAALFQIADGLQVTASLSLRGLKDASAPMWIAGASYWLAGAPVGIMLGFALHLGGLGIWLGLAFGLFVAAAALTARFAVLSKKAAPA